MQLYIAEHTFILSFTIVRKWGIQDKRHLYAFFDDSNCRCWSLNTAKTNNKIYVVYVYVERKDIDVNKHKELSNYSIMSITHTIQYQ